MVDYIFIQSTMWYAIYFFLLLLLSLVLVWYNIQKCIYKVNVTMDFCISDILCRVIKRKRLEFYKEWRNFDFWQMAKKQEGIPHNHILEIILMNPKLDVFQLLCPFTKLHKEFTILLLAFLYVFPCKFYVKK